MLLLQSEFEFQRLFYHPPTDKLLKRCCPQRFAAFAVCLFGALKILRSSQAAHAHKSIPTAAIFVFRQPGILGPAPSLDRDLLYTGIPIRTRYNIADELRTEGC